jgi:hypothetical protein
MVRLSRVLVLPLAAFALFLAAGRGSAQTVIVTQPAPTVSYYYAPPPVVLPAPVPVTTYYAPATAVTTYRYGAVLPRRRVAVTTYSPAVVTYAPPPVVVRPAPRAVRYYTPVYVYP